ncbi:hypothetical protein M4S82_01170 [Planococcus sp. MERTA32b]|nr:hypothetical protein [Planococcus sp. MER TA 32b]
MHPTTVIEIGLVSALVALLSGAAFLLKKTYRKFVWIVVGAIVLSSLAYYSTRPFIVKSQQAAAVEKLDSYLTGKYRAETWVITDTDAHELQEVINLHVIFDNEPSIVYEYEVAEETIEQLSFWNLHTGESGVVFEHLE